MPLTVRLRSADIEDLELLLAIERETLCVAYAHVFPPDRYPFPVAQVREEWKTILASGTARTVVAEAGGNAVGTVTVEPPHLKRLFVLPDRQGRGVGHLLHDWACSALVAAGAGTLELQVLEANEHARRFYRRHGWRQEGPANRSPYPPHPAVLTYQLRRPRMPHGGQLGPFRVGEQTGTYTM